MGIFQKITALFARKQEIEKEIAKLQKNCNHKKRTVKNIRENVDSSTPVVRWVCDECYKVIGYPNNKEIKNFFKE
jgi:transposase-like protein